jgi:hypothetical protein
MTSVKCKRRTAWKLTGHFSFWYILICVNLLGTSFNTKKKMEAVLDANKKNGLEINAAKMNLKIWGGITAWLLHLVLNGQWVGWASKSV